VTAIGPTFDPKAIHDIW